MDRSEEAISINIYVEFAKLVVRYLEDYIALNVNVGPFVLPNSTILLPKLKASGHPFKNEIEVGSFQNKRLVSVGAWYINPMLYFVP